MMNELIEFLTSKEIIVVYIVAAIACLLCFIIYLVDKNYYKRKQRHNTKELNKLVEEVSEIVDQESYAEPIETYQEPVLSPVVEEYVARKEVNVEPVQSEQITIDTIENTEPAVTETVPTEVVEEIESLEEEPVEPINVEDLVLSTMVEEEHTYTPEPEVLSIADVMPKEPVVEPTPVQEELEYTSIEPNRQQAQEELMRLTEELEKAEQEAKTIDLTAYEEEQEENAIISLEELEKKSKEMYESNEITQYADEGNEPISLEDLERRMQTVQEDIKTLEEEPVIITTAATVEELEPTKVELADFNTIQLNTTQEVVEEPIKVEPAKPLSESYQATHKFERSPVISPIYGIERKDSAEDIALENTANYDKLDEEIKKTNEFLMTLRELQKNLD